MTFSSILNGKMQSRGRDAHGGGQPGAKRGHRTHSGLDIITVAGEQILSPFSCDIIREAFPYPDDSSMRGILLRGEGPFDGWEIKLFYVLGLFSGRAAQGQIIGHAQDLTQKYPGITNHVHLEAFWRGEKVDPREPFLSCF